MTKKQADRELDYRIGEITLATMFAEGLITREEYEAARRHLIVGRSNRVIAVRDRRGLRSCGSSSIFPDTVDKVGTLTGENNAAWVEALADQGFIAD